MIRRTGGFTVVALISLALLWAVPGYGQSLSIADRIAWEEALLALEDGDDTDALVLLEDVIESAGPVPAVLYDAAWVSFEARDYERAEDYIMAVLETTDAEYKESDQYDSAFILAAEIRRTLRPLRDSMVAATPLPFSDSLARMGFARAARDRSGTCEWRFDRGGLVAEHDDRTTCMNGTAAATGRVRIEVTIEQRGGGSKSGAGMIFGHEDSENFHFLRVHPRWTEAGGDMSLVTVEAGRETVVMTSTVTDSRGRPLRSSNNEGPWRIAIEIRGRKVDWFIDGAHAGTGNLDREVRGGVMAAVTGTDSGEYLFTSLSIDNL